MIGTGGNEGVGLQVVAFRSSIAEATGRGKEVWSVFPARFFRLLLFLFLLLIFIFGLKFLSYCLEVQISYVSPVLISIEFYLCEFDLSLSHLIVFSTIIKIMIIFEI